jgi:hypothetical protein
MDDTPQDVAQGGHGESGVNKNTGVAVECFDAPTGPNVIAQGNALGF